MRNPEYQFADTSAEAIVARLVSDYKKNTGAAVQPASPERQIIQWVASILVQERVLMNVIGNQNIPSRAEGENLDALAQLLKLQGRPQAQPAVCTQRFYISEAQQSAVLVPQGTRVTCSGGLIWETVEDVYICPMHKARALANAYYWNRLYRARGEGKRFQIHVPKDWALEILPEEEWELLKRLEEK